MRFVSLANFARKIAKLIVYLARVVVSPDVVTNHGVKLNLKDPVLAPYRKMIYMNSWETAEVMLMKKYLNPDDKVLEVGACIGFVSTCASLLVGADNVTAVEANPNLIEPIKRMGKFNSTPFDVINAIIAKNSKYRVFHSNESIYSSSEGERFGSKSACQVECLDLQDLPCAERATFIILDIEGGEYEFFRDFEMPSCVDKVLVEFHGINKNSGLKTNFYPETLRRLEDQSFRLLEAIGRVHFFARNCCRG